MSRARKVHGIKVGEITHKRPGNGLPRWVKDAAETRGYGDALEPISLYVTDADIDSAFKCAAQGNGSKCVMAQAGQRLGAKSVYFYRTTAWVDFGTGPILRFLTTKTIYSNVITPFDKGERENVAGGLYPLTPPTKSKTLKSRRKYEDNKKSTKNSPPKSQKKILAHTDRVVMAAQA